MGVVTSPRPIDASVTIANNASLSGAVELGSARLVGIEMPGAWTTAGITFQVSSDGTNFSDLYDDSTERTYAVAASRYVAVPLDKWTGIRHIKVRSGTAGSPVNQGAARVIKLSLLP